MLALIVALLAAMPLLDDRYFFKAHDAPHSVFFLVEFDRSIRDGALWPRWQSNFVFGYGYPVFTVYAPLAYFVAELFVLAGLGVVGAVKATYIVGILGSAAAMYLLGRRLYGPAAGVLAAAVYTFVPYHLLDLYVRSAFAESFALVWLPLVLWAWLRLEGRPDGDDGVALEAVRRGPTARSVGVAGLALAGLILTHSPTMLAFAPLAGLFVVWRFVERVVRGDRSRGLAGLFGRYVASGVLAAGLSAIFLLPFLAEARYVRTSDWTSGQFDYRQHFVAPHQFFSPFWGFGYSDPALSDTMGFQLGLAAIVLGAFALAGSPLAMPRRARRAAAFFALATALFAFLMTPAAAAIWAAVPNASLLQFPWRLLVVTAVTLAPLAAAAVAGLEQRFGDTTSAVRAVAPLVIGVMVAGFSFVRAEPTPIGAQDVTPLAIVEFESQTYSGATTFAEVVPADSPMVAQYRAGEVPNRWAMSDPSATVTLLREGGESGSARITTPNGGSLVYRTYDFPGWQVTVDGRPVEHRRSTPLALITVDLLPGDYIVSVRMGTTPARTAGTIISAASLVLTLILIAGWRPRVAA